MAFSASDAAFEGFRLARRKPMTLLIWALLYLLFTVAIFALAGGSIVGLMNAANELEGVVNPTPDDMAPFMTAYFGLLAWLGPLALAFSAVMYTAVNRAVLRPQEKGFGHVRLGMDEVRVGVVMVVLTILGAILGFLVAVTAALVVGLAQAALGDAGGLVAVLAFIGMVVLFVWLCLRFSLALSITFAERRFAIFDSWKVTKGRTLGLLGMALIAFVMVIVVQILATLVALPLVLAVGGFGQLAQIDSMGLDQILATMGPVVAVYLVLTAVVSALQLGIMYAPFAAAYRDITGVNAGPAPSL